MSDRFHVHTLLIDLRGIDPQRRYSDLWFRPFGEYRRVLDELIANGIGFVHGGGHPTGLIVAVKVQAKKRGDNED